jgi:hypothetical protein
MLPYTNKGMKIDHNIFCLHLPFGRGGMIVIVTKAWINMMHKIYLLRVSFPLFVQTKRAAFHAFPPK